MMDKDLKSVDSKVLKRVSEVKEEIAKLESELDTFKPAVVDMFSTYQTPTLETEYGVFSLVVRKTWKFSKKVDQLEKMVKAEKAREQIAGIATATETQSFMLRQA